MKQHNYRYFSALALVLIGGATGLVACSSDGGNAGPSTPPVITAGKGGGGGESGEGDAGESSGGTDTGGKGGEANGGADPVGDAGEAGAAGSTGGAGPTPTVCPATDDVGFLNQPSTSQKVVFDNVKRLGTHATLPPLP